MGRERLTEWKNREHDKPSPYDLLQRKNPALGNLNWCDSFDLRKHPNVGETRRRRRHVRRGR